MKSQYYTGSAASLIAAFCFIIGFVLYLSLLADPQYGELAGDPLNQVNFLLEHRGLLHAWYSMIYIVFGIALLGLTTSLGEIAQTGSEFSKQLSVSLGLVWVVLVIASGLIATVGNEAVAIISARDFSAGVSLWLVVQVLSNALGGGNEIVGSLWITSVSYGFSHRPWAKTGLIYFGYGIGVSGLLTVIPVLEPAGAIFGFGCIGWFIWVGIKLALTGRQDQAAC